MESKPYLGNRNTHRPRERPCGCQGGGGHERGKDWESGLSSRKLLSIEWINRVLLYSTGNSVQYPGINHSGKEYEKESVHLYH